MCSRRQDMISLPEMFVPVLVLVVAYTQRPNPTEARPGYGDQPPRLRRPLAGREVPSRRREISERWVSPGPSLVQACPDQICLSKVA